MRVRLLLMALSVAIGACVYFFLTSADTRRPADRAPDSRAITANTPGRSPSDAPHSLDRPAAPNSIPTTSLAPDGETVWILTGDVYGAVDRQPIAGAQIDYGFEDESGFHRRQSTTDESGRFALPLPSVSPDVSVSLVVRKSGFATRTYSHERVAIRDVGSIPLVPAVRVTGEVVYESGAPVREGSVCVRTERANGADSSWEEPLHVQAFACRSPQLTAQPLDRHGRFSMEVESSLFAVEVWGSDFAPTISDPLLPSPGGDHHVRIVVRPDSVLRGEVRSEDGIQLSGASIEVLPAVARGLEPQGYYCYSGTWRAESRADGSFSIGGLPDVLESAIVRCAGCLDENIDFRCNPVPRTPYMVTLRRSPGAGPQADATRTLTGTARVTVLDPKGRPVGGAVVATDSWLDPQVAVCDAGGVAWLDGLSLASHVLEATHVDHSPGIGFVHILTSGTVAETEIRLVERTALRFSIRGAAGEFPRIAGALLRSDPIQAVPGAPPRRKFYPDAGADYSGEPVGCELVDAQGSVEFDGFPAYNPLRLGVWAEGHLPTWLDVPPFEAGESRNLGVVQLSPGCRIRASVTDTEGAPVVGAFVSTDPEEPYRVNGARVESTGAVTDSMGVARLFGVQPGTLEVHCSSPGYHVTEPQAIELTEDCTEAAIAFVLRRQHAHDFEVQLLWADGTPALGMECILMEDDAGLWRGYSDLEGRSRVRATTAGPFSIEVDWERLPDADPDSPHARLGHEPPEIVVAAASIAELPKTIELPLAGGIEIAVDTPPVPSSFLGATLNVRPLQPDGLPAAAPIEVSIDLVDGRWGCARVEPGLYEFALRIVNLDAPEPVRRYVEAGETERIDWRLGDALSSILVRVASDDGTPIEAADVHLHSSEYGSSSGPGEHLRESRCHSLCLAHARTDAQGGAALIAVALEREKLMVSAAGFADFILERPSPSAMRSPIEVVLSPPATVEVTILDAAGNPVTDASIWSFRASEYSSPPSDGDGTCVLRGLLPGAHEIDVWVDD